MALKTGARVEVSQSAFAEVRSKLEAAGLRHVMGVDGGRQLLDMNGIALQPCQCSPEVARRTVPRLSPRDETVNSSEQECLFIDGLPPGAVVSYEPSNSARQRVTVRWGNGDSDAALLTVTVMRHFKGVMERNQSCGVQDRPGGQRSTAKCIWWTHSTGVIDVLLEFDSQDSQ